MWKRFCSPFAALLLAALLGVTGCSGPSSSESTTPPPAPVPAKPKPADLSRLMGSDGRQSATVVEDHLLGLEDLPGGTLAEYEKNGKKYQQFLFQAPSVALTAVYLNDIKKAMSNPKFIAGYGGYFGEIDGKPVFVFVKNEYVTGLVGLTQQEADAEGRLVAARIP